MEQKKYYKVIGKNFGNYPYKLGLNTLADNGEVFNSDPSCTPGGIYFCTIENISNWLHLGNEVCELSIPEDAQVIELPGKFKADKIFIERIFPLDIKVLAKLGAYIGKNNYQILLQAAKAGDLDHVKVMVEDGADIRAGGDNPLRVAARCGHLDVVKYLVEHGANVHAYSDYNIGWARINGDFDMIEYLLSLP